MSRPKKKIKDLKTSYIKIYMTKQEKENYDLHKSLLSISSPALSPNDILRECVKMIDDKALIQFLQLDKNSPIRTQLLQDYLFSSLTN